jgi:hypothetical protein
MTDDAAALAAARLRDLETYVRREADNGRLDRAIANAIINKAETAALAALPAPLPAPDDWTVLPTAAQMVVDSWPEAGQIVTREQVRSLMQGARLDLVALAAPPAPLPLDVAAVQQAVADVRLAAAANGHGWIETTTAWERLEAAAGLTRLATETPKPPAPLPLDEKALTVALEQDPYTRGWNDAMEHAANIADSLWESARLATPEPK